MASSGGKCSGGKSLSRWSFNLGASRLMRDLSTRDGAAAPASNGGASSATCEVFMRRDCLRHPVKMCEQRYSKHMHARMDTDLAVYTDFVLLMNELKPDQILLTSQRQSPRARKGVDESQGGMSRASPEPDEESRRASPWASPLYLTWAPLYSPRAY